MVAYRALAQLSDPFRTWRGLRALPWFFSDYRRYRKLAGAEAIAWSDLEPSLHERVGAHELDAHYFFVNAWAMRRVIHARPERHFDFASQTVLAAQISSVVPVTYVDYRPLNVQLNDLGSVAADLLNVPFLSGSLRSMSCLHVAEHVGLGRYGDPLDPAGTRKAAAELARVLAPGGNLFFALPIGRARVAFNAHRVHAASTIVDYFADLELLEYSGVGDDGRFVEHVAIDRFDRDEYACGMFWFKRRAS
jgi:SAM-dependent methyltransferase